MLLSAKPESKKENISSISFFRGKSAISWVHSGEKAQIIEENGKSGKERFFLPKKRGTGGEGLTKTIKSVNMYL